MLGHFRQPLPEKADIAEDIECQELNVPQRRSILREVAGLFSLPITHCLVSSVVDTAMHHAMDHESQFKRSVGTQRKQSDLRSETR